MKLQRFQDNYSGCEEHPEGDFVLLEDVLALLQELSSKLDDPDVIGELEEDDLNGSSIVNEYIGDNT